MKQHNQGNDGFTLLNLLFALGLSLLVMALALPGLRGWWQTVELKLQAQAFVAFLHQARSYAIDHDQIIQVCPQSNSQRCGTHWENGAWFYAKGALRPVLMFHWHLPNLQVWLRSSLGWRSLLRWNPMGMGAQQGRIYLCRIGKATCWVLAFRRHGAIYPMGWLHPEQS